MAGYSDKYRTSTKTRRLIEYDYALPGAYFVTICTKDTIDPFGNIMNSCMHLSNIGNIVYKNWQAIPIHSKNTILDEFTIMPDHVHGIIRIIGGGHRSDVACSDVACNVATRKTAKTSVPEPTNTENIIRPNAINGLMSKISPKANSLSVIIRSFKSACTKCIDTQFPQSQFEWQPRFHDHIVRNDDELERIRWYIRNNPKNWEKDGKDG